MTEPSFSPVTRMERGIELIEQMRIHPAQEEILRLAAEQMADLNHDIENYPLVTDAD